MATIMSHSIAALAVGKAVAPPGMPAKFWIATAVCAALPDLDVVSFAFDVPYGDMLGHRGITHSLPFALALALVVVMLFFRGTSFAGPWWLLVIYFFLVTASHAVLDALTNGGLGVAFFAPFSGQRYFFPWRPIEVSPIGLGFLSARGVMVLLNEIVWIWTPSAVVVFLAWLFHHSKS
jgi:inner membrane protein